MRSTVVTLSCLVLLATPAWGTGQDPEVLHINGRVVDLLTTPLDPLIEPLLERREDLRERFASTSSSLWRGYVGTWHIEGEQLLLVSLSSGDDDPEPIPLSTLPLPLEGPVPATWFTGTLRVPVGWARRYVHRGFAATWNEELLIHIVRGRVVGQEVLDVRQALRGRSKTDLAGSIVGPNSPAVPGVSDRGPWTDARSIGTAAFRKAIPEGAPFVTRGVLARTEDSPYEKSHRYLLAPRTPVTKEVEFRLVTDLGLSTDDAYRRVEIDAIWQEEHGKTVLDVRWLRFLRYGETIHHPDFPLPELPPLSSEEPPGGFDESLHYAHFGTVRAEAADELDDALYSRLVELHGTLTEGVPFQVLGVDVADADDLEGKMVVVPGMLQKWVITARLLKLGHRDVEAFRTRGPGTYYRIVAHDTGELARPRAGK